MNAEHTTSRVPELDAVRGLAAGAVVVTHLPRGFWFGETGVELFFVMSGYLITSIIVKNLGRPGFLRNFYARRALRIWPIYYLALSVVVALSLARQTQSSYDGWWYYVLYIQNVPVYWGAGMPAFAFSLGHTWTLAIEEQFYILWPLLLMATGRRGVLPLAVLLIIAPVGFRAAGAGYFTLLGHTEGFGWGALLTVVTANGRGGRRRAALVAAVGLLAVLGYLARCEAILAEGVHGRAVVYDNASIALVNLFYFAVVGLTVAGSGLPLLAPLRWRPLVYLGQISYGLYLYHWIIYEQLDTVIKFGLGYGDPVWLDALKVGVSLAAAVVSWHLIEKPILRLKYLFEYKPPALAPG